MNGDIRKRTGLLLAAVIVCAILLPLTGACVPVTAYASSWLDSSDSPIYAPDDSSEEGTISDVGEILDEVEVKRDGITDTLGDLVGSALTFLADGLYELLDRMGININSTVYGRVGGAAEDSNGINLTSFELVTGNIYGIVGGAIYQIFASAMLLIAICVFSFKLAGYLISPTGSNKANVKSFLGYGITAVAAVFLMPYFLYTALYIRDVLLYMTAIGGGTVVSGIRDAFGTAEYSGIEASGIGVSNAIFGNDSKYSIVVQLSVSASDGNLLSGLLYMGGVGLTIYFMFLYISQALTMLILYVLFPFVSVAAVFNKQIVGEWIRNIMGIMILPIIDSVLLSIAMCFFILSEDQAFLSGFTIISLAIAWCIIPARKQVRQWLGLGGGGAFENASVGAVLGLYKATAATAGFALKGGMALASGGASIKSAVASKSLDGKLAPISQEAAGFQRSAMADLSAENGGVDGFESASKEEQEKMADDAAGIKKGMSHEEILRGRATSISNMRVELREKKGEAEADIRAFDRSINASKLSIAHSESEKAAHPDNKELQVRENANIAGERAKIQQNEILKGGRQRDVRRIEEKIGKTDQSLKALRAGYGSYVTNSDEDRSMQGQYDRMANMENFELPEFNGKISTKRRAELQRKRAIKQAITSGASAGGMFTGGIVGGLTGVGLASFMGAGPMLMGGGIGMEAGGTLGKVAGVLVGGAYGLSVKAMDGSSDGGMATVRVHRAGNSQRTINMPGTGSETPEDEIRQAIQRGVPLWQAVQIHLQNNGRPYMVNTAVDSEGLAESVKVTGKAVLIPGANRIAVSSAEPYAVQMYTLPIGPMVVGEGQAAGQEPQIAQSRVIRELYDTEWRTAMVSMDDRGRNEYRDIIIGAQKEAVSTVMANRAHGQYAGLTGEERVRVIRKEANDVYMDAVKYRMRKSKLVKKIENSMPQGITEEDLEKCLDSHILRDAHKADRFYQMLDAMGLYSEEGG